MIIALNTLSESQAAPTPTTMKNMQQFLDYAASNPNAELKYVASNMKLWIDSDAAYLVAPKAKSRVTGYYYLSDQP